jgi:hypothetical protein
VRSLGVIGYEDSGFRRAKEQGIKAQRDFDWSLPFAPLLL